MAKYKIEWPIEARLDLIDILEFYINRNSSNSYSKKLNSKINRSLKLLVKNPLIGLKSQIESVRVLITGDYQIVYEITDNIILIVMIWDCRRDPEDKIIEVCKKIDKSIVLLGGTEDVEKGERIKMEVGEKIYNSCGKFTLNQSASLVRQAEKIITNDTGLMHVAAAFNKEIISLWGNTIPEFGMYPYMPGNEKQSQILEVKDLNCRPCSKIGFQKCPKGHFKCMIGINSDEIVRLTSFKT